MNAWNKVSLLNNWDFFFNPIFIYQISHLFNVYFLCNVWYKYCRCLCRKKSVSVSDIISCSRHRYVISLFLMSYYISLLDIKWYHCFRYHVLLLIFKCIIMSLFKISHQFPVLVITLCLSFRYHIMTLFQIIYHVVVSDFKLLSYVCCRYHISCLL